MIGAPGATQIAMGVLQAILNVVDFGMTMTEAVSAPRFSATSNAIDVTNRIPYGTTRRLEVQGYEVVRSAYTFGVAAVHGIRIDGDKLDGGADPGTTVLCLESEPWRRSISNEDDCEGSRRKERSSAVFRPTAMRTPGRSTASMN